MAHYILLNSTYFFLAATNQSKCIYLQQFFTKESFYCRKPKAAIYQHILTFFSCMPLRIVKVQKQKNTFIKTGLTYLYTRGNKI